MTHYKIPRLNAFKDKTWHKDSRSTPRTGTGAVAFNKLFHLFLCMQNRDNFTSAFHRAFGEALLFVQVIWGL